MEELPGVDEPNDGNQEGIKEEHHRLLLDYAVGLAVNVAHAESLHHQRHHGSCEEKTHRVLQSEGKLVFTACPVHFNVSDAMEEGGDDEFIEEGDGDHGEDGYESSSPRVHVVDCVCFGVEDEVEDDGDHAQQQPRQQPPQRQTHCPHCVGVVYVLPDDLLWFGGTLHSHSQTLHAEVLQQHVVLHLRGLLDQRVLLAFSGEDDDRLVADGGVPADHLHLLQVLLLHHLLPLLDLPVQICQSSFLLSTLRPSHPLLLPPHQLQLLLPQLEEVLQRVQDDHFLHLILPFQCPQEGADLADTSCFLWEVHEHDCEVGDEGVPFLVILQRFKDGVADVEEAEQLYDEGADAEQTLLGRHFRLCSHEHDEPAVTASLVATRQQVLLPVGAEFVCAFHCPVETEHAVADHLQRQKDDGVFVEHEVEREAEPQELQLFCVLAERDGRLVDHPQAAMAEVGRVLTQQRLHFSHCLQAVGVYLPQEPRGTGAAVICSHLPVRIELVQVQHLNLRQQQYQSYMGVFTKG